MKTTVLWLHNTTACWTLWQRGQLLKVHCELVTRELAGRAILAEKKDGLHTLCPWLAGPRPRVRLVIDPVADNTRVVPAYNRGVVEAQGVGEYISQLAERLILRCRSLTSDVLADDLTRYRRDQLNRVPGGMLQWHRPKAPSFRRRSEKEAPRDWLLTESGVPDYVFDWLNALVDHGLEFLDVRPVSSLFVSAAIASNAWVLTVWVEANRVRLLVADSRGVLKVEQWANESDAQIALKDLLDQYEQQGVKVTGRFIGSSTQLKAWQLQFGALKLVAYSSGLQHQQLNDPTLIDALPKRCLDLPIASVSESNFRPHSWLWRNTSRTDVGSYFRTLLSTAQWRRRYQQSMVATTIAATCSGYFVLLACMHGLDFIELHDKAQRELERINVQQQAVQRRSESLHPDPNTAQASIERLQHAVEQADRKPQRFFEELATLLDASPVISLNSVSWREAPGSRTGLPSGSAENPVDLTSLPELVDLAQGAGELAAGNGGNGGGYGGQAISERLVLLSGKVKNERSQQAASDALISFLSALSNSPLVINVTPLTNALSEVPSMNLPSDVQLNQQDPTAFVLAIRVKV